MIPKTFAKLHPKYKTPINALILIGVISAISPFAGRQMLVWVSDAGNVGCCLAYCMVSISFLILRKKAPDMPRPYKVKHDKLIGYSAVLLSGGMVAMYIIPESGSTLAPQEWLIAGAWSLVGLLFYSLEKRKYGKDFGKHVDIEVEYSDEDMEAIQSRMEEEV